MYNRYWGSDRRRFQRLNLNLIVWYKVVSPYDSSYTYGQRDMEATTLDISPLGMAFVAIHSIPVYAKVALKFIVFSSHAGSYSHLAMPIEVNGEVRSCMPHENKEYRIGVCFKGIEMDKQAQLADFVKESLRPCI